MDQICARYADGPRLHRIRMRNGGLEPELPTFSDTARTRSSISETASIACGRHGGMVHINEADVVRESANAPSASSTTTAHVRRRAQESSVVGGHLVDAASRRSTARLLAHRCGRHLVRDRGFRLFRERPPWHSRSIRTRLHRLRRAERVRRHRRRICLVHRNNALGRLGTGDESDLAQETQVAPPGSALVCPAP